MLYITTRNHKDAFTAPRTLSQDLAQDEGLFVPFRMPTFSQAQISELKEKSAGETIAQILNLFFSSHINGWDVDFCIGRNSTKLSSLNHKTVIAEMWHNPDADLNYVIQGLYRKVYQDSGRNATEWFSLTVRIALMFAVFGEMLRQNLLTPSDIIDSVVPGNNLLACTAVIFAREMGLPIKAVICGCSEGMPVLELLRRGVLSTKTLRDTWGIERLLHSCLNSSKAKGFSESYKQGESYHLNAEDISALNRNLFTAAVSQERIGSVIHSTYRTGHYLVDEKTAIALAGLQDYRTATGENRIAIVFSDVSPMASARFISRILGIPLNELRFS